MSVRRGECQEITAFHVLWMTLVTSAVGITSSIILGLHHIYRVDLIRFRDPKSNRVCSAILVTINHGTLSIMIFDQGKAVLIIAAYN
jgi:hypothetical protein